MALLICLCRRVERNNCNHYHKTKANTLERNIAYEWHTGFQLTKFLTLPPWLFCSLIYTQIPRFLGNLTQVWRETSQGQIPLRWWKLDAKDRMQRNVEGSGNRNTSLSEACLWAVEKNMGWKQRHSGNRRMNTEMAGRHDGVSWTWVSILSPPMSLSLPFLA